MANEKRKHVEKLILETVKMMEGETTLNYDNYKKLFASMSDKDFDIYMKELKSGKRKLTFVAPNMKIVLKHKDIMRAAEHVGAEIFTRITYTDPVTGVQYTPEEKQMVLNIPIKRTRQYLHHGLSVPEGDTHFDNMTGQVMKPDQSARISFNEMQILHTLNMNNTILEYAKVRGGDIHAYSEFRQQLEETGSCSLKSLSKDTLPRSVMVASLVLKCMGLDNNFADKKVDDTEIKSAIGI